MAQIITAIDTPTVEQARQLIAPLKNKTMFKFGLEFAEHCGPQGLAELGLPPASLFLDHKWLDIPNTVAGALRGAVRSTRPALVNVHALGGEDMMKAAVDIVKTESPETALVAVTVLTSLDDTAVSAILGRPTTASDFALHLAELAQKSGCDGVVCAGIDIAPIKQNFGADFLTVVPGLRPHGSPAADQKRVFTPAEAATAGADYLVIGRPITGADTPYEALENIRLSLG